MSARRMTVLVAWTGRGVGDPVCLWRNLSLVLLASFPAGPLQANCYFAATAPGADCAIVDPGQNSKAGVEQVVTEYNLNPVAVLVTHGHFDHMWEAAEVADEYDAELWIHPADRHLLTDPLAAISGESAAMLRAQFGIEDDVQLSEPATVRDAVDGAQIEVGDLTFTVEHVPGHTPGTVVYTVDYDGPEDISAVMFAGDFLFAGSIGRTDLTGGSMEEMTDSLRKAVLPAADDTVVLPGHGPQTTIARERATNPFLAELT